MSKRPIPVTIRGRRFASMCEAARAFGLTPRAIQNARARGTLDRVGLAAREKPVVIRGETYPSQIAAAAAFGVTESAISVAKRRGGLDRVGLSK